MVGGYTAGNPFDALIIGCYGGREAEVRGRRTQRIRSAHALRSVPAARSAAHGEMSLFKPAPEAVRAMGI